MSGRVMVFAPAPRLTITLESAHDEVELHIHAGGQGFWQARMINSLGVPVTLCCALGGETGRVLRTLIAAEGVDLADVAVSASNGAYVHDRRGGSRVELAHISGQALSRHEQDDLYGTAIGHAFDSTLCLLSGVASPNIVPPSMYRRLAGDLRRNGRPTMADLSGPYLAAALGGGLDFVKVSDEELVADGRAADYSQSVLTDAMRAMKSEGARSVIVTRAERPALVLEDDRPVLAVVMPTLEPVDSFGAGDSMTAAIAAVLATGGDLLTALPTGAAAGALNVTRRGLGSGDLDAITRLARRVKLAEPGHSDDTPPVIGDRDMSVTDLTLGPDT